MVKDYQSKREYLVLSLVRRYPLYSLNKLAEELPGISRHSIQRILERNDLSTVEKRLAFSAEQKSGLSVAIEKLKRGLSFFEYKRLNLAELTKLSKRFQLEPRLNWRLVRNFAILAALVFVLWQGTSFVLAKPPEIRLERPEMGFVNEGERLFVIGKVIPARSRVTANGNEVSLNGDGSFTAVVNIPMGESILEVGAVRKRKVAKVLRLVKRVPTQEELQAQKEEEAVKKQKAADRAAELERTVNDLMAAKQAVMKPGSAPEALLKVLNNKVKKEAGFASVVGEVVNLGSQPVSWVMITARFFDQTGKGVDTKYGFATDFDEVLKPREKAEFETQVTLKEFDHYSLELSWEKAEVAGIATEAAERTTESEEVE